MQNAATDQSESSTSEIQLCYLAEELFIPIYWTLLYFKLS